MPTLTHCRSSAADLVAAVDPTLRRLARRWAAGYGLDADDVFQDARLIVVAHARQFDPAKNTPAGWARTLALGALRDGVRDAVREDAGYKGWRAERRRSAAGGLAALMQDEGGEVVRRAVAALPPEDAEVVRRIFGIGRRPSSLRAVARRLGKSPGAVSRQLSAAGRRLRASLADCSF